MHSSQFNKSVMLIVLLLSLCLSACGQTGRLYLPSEEPNYEKHHH